jgi:uncharacterized protein (TIGR03086 family)
VHVSVTCYGSTGPWALRGGFDMNGSAASGLMVIEGGPDNSKLPPTGLVNDFITGYMGALGAAACIGTSIPDGDSIDQRVQHVTQPILAAWRRRGLTDDVVFSGRTLPAHLALGILSLELAVHGWDFAVALHCPLNVSDAHAAHILALAQQTPNAQSRATAGFDPPVPVSTDASALDQLIAFTGRDPRQMNPGGDCRSPG